MLLESALVLRCLPPLENECVLLALSLCSLSCLPAKCLSLPEKCANTEAMHFLYSSEQWPLLCCLRKWEETMDATNKALQLCYKQYWAHLVIIINNTEAHTHSSQTNIISPVVLLIVPVYHWIKFYIFLASLLVWHHQQTSTDPLGFHSWIIVHRPTQQFIQPVEKDVPFNLAVNRACTAHVVSSRLRRSFLKNLLVFLKKSKHRPLLDRLWSSTQTTCAYLSVEAALHT